jgi:hypothetical protein
VIRRPGQMGARSAADDPASYQRAGSFRWLPGYEPYANETKEQYAERIRRTFDARTPHADLSYWRWRIAFVNLQLAWANFWHRDQLRIDELEEQRRTYVDRVITARRRVRGGISLD